MRGIPDGPSVEKGNDQKKEWVRTDDNKKSSRNISMKSGEGKKQFPEGRKPRIVRKKGWEPEIAPFTSTGSRKNVH